jgi:hypothetical protein
VWLDRLPDLRRMVEFLFLAERRTDGRQRDVKHTPPPPK